MKTLRMVGMALMAVLMGVNCASCTKGDKPSSEDFSNEKKLMKFESDDDYIAFTYDNKGRLIKAERNDGYKQMIKWEDDVVRTTDNVDYIYTLPLSDGLVQSIYFDDYKGSEALYNLSDRLFKWSDDETETRFIWDEDKLVYATYEEYGHTYNFALTYEGSCKKGYFPLLHTIVDFETSLYLLFAHPELWGLRTTQLPSRCTCTYGNNSQYTETYSYELDEDGYISKMVVTEGDSELYTYTFTWK